MELGQVPSVPKEPIFNSVAEAAVLQKQPIFRGRKGIPAATVREIWKRDEFICVYTLPCGSRCGSKIGLQVDHIQPVAFGQDNRLVNLRLLCRECNIAAAEKVLGSAVMERYRWLRSRTQSECFVYL